MKNILIVLLILALSVFGFYFILNRVDFKYQSAIAVALATASIQLVLFFLKLEFDRNSHKNTKSYGVVYDKKFIIYNEIIAQIIDARSYFVHFTKVQDFSKQEDLFNKIEDIKRTILKNRITISNSVFIDINLLYGQMRANYDNYVKALLYDDYKGSGLDVQVETYIKSNKLDNQIADITDIMRRELKVF